MEVHLGHQIASMARGRSSDGSGPILAILEACVQNACFANFAHSN